jgi:hypothetical protein
MTAKFERDHGVAGLFVEERKLAARVSTAASATNACRDLFPIRHLVDAL